MALAIFGGGDKRLRSEVRDLKRQLHERVSSPIVQDNEQFVGFGDARNAKAVIDAIEGSTASAIRVIRQRIQSLPIGVFIRRFVDGDFEDQPAFDHLLQKLLNNPTADQNGVAVHSRDQFFGLIVTQYESVGVSDILVIHDGAGVPRRLQMLKPGTIEPIIRRGALMGYRVFSTGSGSTLRTLRPMDVVRIWEPDAYDLHEPRSIMGKSADIIDTDMFVTKRWRKFYEFDAVPRVAFEAAIPGEGTLPTPEEKEELDLTWTQKFNKLVGNRIGRPAWVHPSWKLRELSNESDATSGVTMMDHNEKRVFRQFGVSTFQVGGTEAMNRAVAETALFGFDRNTALPITRAIADALTSQLAVQYPVVNDNVELIVKFLPFIARDKAFDLQQDQIDVQTKIRSPNEVRADREPAMDDASWGDFPPGTFGDTPYLGEPEEDLDLSEFTLDSSTPSESDESTVTPVEEGEETEEEPRSRDFTWRYLRVHFEPKREWERIIQRDQVWTPRFRTAQRSLFRRQGEITLQRFLAEVRSREVWDRGHGDDLAEELFPLEGWEDLFRISTEPIRAASFVSSADEATEAIIGQSFRLTQVARAALLEMNLEHIAFVNETTQAALATQLSEGLAAGESTDQIAARIVDTFGTRRSEATRIARTEIAQAVQVAQVQGYRQSGVVEKKRWNTSLDAKVRDTHVKLEGRIRELDEDFSSTIQGPAQASFAKDRIHCRCFLTPVFEDEKE